MTPRAGQTGRLPPSTRYTKRHKAPPPATSDPPAAGRLLSPSRGQVTPLRRGGGGGAGLLRASRRGARLGPRPPAHPRLDGRGYRHAGSLRPRLLPRQVVRRLPASANAGLPGPRHCPQRASRRVGSSQLWRAARAGPVFNWGDAAGPAGSSRARAEESLGAVGERAAAAGPGRQVSRRPPRPHRQQEEEAAGPGPRATRRASLGGGALARGGA